MNVFSENCLAGGTYLVTGASSGIGRAAALLIAQCGGRVIASGRDAERLQAAVAALPGAGHIQSVMVLQDADQTADWIKELVTHHGALSGIFHAAGIDLVRPARLCKQAHLDAIFGSSLYAAFGIARAVNQKNIMQDGGSIVFMSSAASTTGQSGMTVYSAAKAGINGMVRPLACEMGPRRIRVNAIVAGAAMTAMHERWLNIGSDIATSDYETNHLLGFGEAQDVANAAVFLLSPAARWITGTNMVVDGGYSV